jgi:hypothetical protein
MLLLPNGEPRIEVRSPNSRDSVKIQATTRNANLFAEADLAIGFSIVGRVSAPPSNSATTGRPSTRPNALGFALHSVCIGLAFRIGASRSRKTTFA